MPFAIKHNKRIKVQGSLETLRHKTPYWHGHVAGGTGCAKLLIWGKYIFVFNIRIFSPTQLQILFLLFQDSIFQLFDPEI